MIIEKFHAGKVKDVYKRFAENGRMLPDGVIYINSWIDEKVTTCYQLMESDAEEKINEWAANWNDLMNIEVVPVITSAEAKKKIISG